MTHFRFCRNLTLVCAAAGFAATPKKPLMGWSSWNCYYENITEAAIKKQADAMTASLSAIFAQGRTSCEFPRHRGP